MKTFRILLRAIERFYGEKVPLFVSLRFNGLEGYGWVFPKREYICVGIGGRVGAGRGYSRAPARIRGALA